MIIEFGPLFYDDEDTDDRGELCWDEIGEKIFVSALYECFDRRRLLKEARREILYKIKDKWEATGARDISVIDVYRLKIMFKEVQPPNRLA